MGDFWVVFSNPIDGQDQAFNDWYEHIHLRDIVRQPGAAAAQRFRLADEQIASGGNARASAAHRYLAFYELFDPARMSEVMDVIFSPKMRISNSFEFQSADGGFYSAIASIDNRTAAPGSGDIVIERIHETENADFARWYREARLPALSALPGVASAMLTAQSRVQILPIDPAFHFVAIYRLTNRTAALAGWSKAPALPKGMLAEIACFTPLGGRITVHDVLLPTKAAAAAEERAHRVMGTRYLQGFAVSGKI